MYYSSLCDRHIVNTNFYGVYRHEWADFATLMHVDVLVESENGVMGGLAKSSLRWSSWPKEDAGIIIEEVLQAVSCFYAYTLSVWLELCLCDVDNTSVCGMRSS